MSDNDREIFSPEAYCEKARAVYDAAAVPEDNRHIWPPTGSGFSYTVEIPRKPARNRFERRRSWSRRYHGD